VGTIADDYRIAVDGFARRLAAVGDRWHLPTPCSEWDVRALVAHVLDEQLWIPPLMAGETIAKVGDRFSGDMIGEHAMASWTAATAAAERGASADGLGQRIVHLSMGDTPADSYLREVTTDTVIHTWDLARALGVDDTLDPALVAKALAQLEPVAEAWRAGGVLGARVEVPDDAGTQDRLLALTGRRP